jgi:hypothetical protein
VFALLSSFNNSYRNLVAICHPGNVDCNSNMICVFVYSGKLRSAINLFGADNEGQGNSLKKCIHLHGRRWNLVAMCRPATVFATEI